MPDQRPINGLAFQLLPSDAPPADGGNWRGVIEMTANNWNFLVSATPAGAMSQALDILANNDHANARRNDGRDCPPDKPASAMRGFFKIAAGFVGAISATGITINWLT